MKFSFSLSEQVAQRLREDGTLMSIDEWEAAHDHIRYDDSRRAASMHELLEYLHASGGFELAVAALNGEDDFFRSLIKAGISVSRPDDEEQTPLHLLFVAAWRFIGFEFGKYDSRTFDEDSTEKRIGKAAQKLIREGASLDAQSSDGATALQLAVQGGWLDAARRLRVAGARQFGEYRLETRPALNLQPDATVEATTDITLDYEQAALSAEERAWLVLFSGEPGTPPRLGVHPDAAKPEFSPAARLEVSRDILALFLREGGDLEMTPGATTPATTATQQQVMGELSAIDEWKGRERKGSSLLGCALRDGDEAFSLALLEADARPDGIPKAFALSASFDSTAVAQQLARASQRVNFLSRQGFTPLEHLLDELEFIVLRPVERRKHREIIEPCLERAATPSQSRQLRETHASVDSVLPIARLLLERGARVRYQTLFKASRELEVFALLWPHRPRLSRVQARDLLFNLLTTPNGARPPFHRRNHYVRELLELGADPDFTPNHRFPDDAVYFVAQRLGDAELCQILEDAGAQTEWLRKILLW